MTDSTELATTEMAKQDRPPVSAMDDVSMLPVERQDLVLAEYDRRRNNFRQWLLAHFKKGIHYGYPPGCQPKLDHNGNPAIPKDQWTAKPSLYKAGALFVVDLYKYQIEYEVDEAGWRQQGAHNGMFVMRCMLSMPGMDTVLGEGRGICSETERGSNPNAAIKKAQKRALVDACLNTIPVLADLFTQDHPPVTEPKSQTEAGVDPYTAPEPEPAAEDAPDIKAAARDLYARFRVEMPGVNWKQWLIDTTDGELCEPKNGDEWTWPIIEKLTAVLDAHAARAKGHD